MNDTEELLTALWRSEKGHYQLAEGKTFRSLFVNPISNISKEVSVLTSKGVDVFFACAEYKAATNRKAENASGAWGFWLDIDCSSEKSEAGKGYADLDSAATAIKAFCKEVKLPRPTHIVKSGGGLHIYWALTDFVAHSDWLVSAGKLKALTHQFKLLADDSRTTDIASLLRVPGTLNYKYSPPKPVELLYSGDPFSKSEFLSILDAAYQAHCVNYPVSKSMTASNVCNSMLETSQNISRIKSALASIDPDCDWKVWFDILCALRSLDWSCSEDLARSWSKGEIR
jgi:hypothetical protein